jgi:pyruvate kinase
MPIIIIRISLRSRHYMPIEQKLPAGRFSKTKIVATIGPACESLDRLKALIVAGIDVFRLNMAHGTRQEQEVRLAAVRRAMEETGQFVAVLADLAGPKIRLGELPGGQMDCHAGASLRFVRGTIARQPQELTTTYEPLVDELAVGDRVMLADGTVSLVVDQRGTDFAQCRVVQPGLIRSRQGVNLPGVKLSVPALGPADRENAVWAAQIGIDFIGLSFVRAANDVHQLKSLLTTEKATAQVIAKIEKPEALEHLNEIVAAADGVMVARGDLGVETDIAEVALAQKHIVAACNRQHKPVIIATQMLDSMQHSSLPTRAEVTDVANAILDGADACMLSGETAIGDYPREAVEMMHRIALATEPMLPHNSGTVPIFAGTVPIFAGTVPIFASAKMGLSPLSHGSLPAEAQIPAVNPITQAIVDAAGRIAGQVAAKLIVVASSSGATALALSKNRNPVPILGVSENETTLRRMCLYWGLFPLAGAPVGKSQELLEYVTQQGRHSGYLNPGDRIVLIIGTGLTASAHNAIVVHQLGE